MVMVAGRPILERVILHLVSCGIRRIFIAIHYLGQMIEAHFGDGSSLGCRIEYLREEVPLGTGGALSLLPSRPEEPLLVMNGDLVTQANVAGLLDQHESTRCHLTVAVREYSHTVPFGCVQVDSGRVTCLEEKPILSRLVNAGIYAVDAALLPRVPSGQKFPMTALVEDCIARGEPVGAFPVEGEWIDVGRPSQLLQARGEEPS
jgi:NDP-sugar pyrophosphorylase family protein